MFNRAALEWIMVVFPFQTMRILLQRKLPFLQGFQADLLMYAIEEQRVAFVENLIRVDIGTNSFIQSGDPLRAAISSGNSTLVEKLLAAGSNFGSINNGMWDNTSHKIELTFDIAIILVEAGVDALVLADGCAPIQAIRHKDSLLIRYLMANGADVDFLLPERKVEASTPLPHAVSLGQSETVRLLIDNGANVQVVAIHRHYVKCNELGIGYSRLFTGNLLQVASAYGFTDLVKILLRAGVFVNDPAHGRYGMTALWAVIEFGHEKTVECLANNGADVNITKSGTLDGSDTTIALWAALYAWDNPLDTAEMILQHGADIEAPESTALEFPRTALLMTIENNDFDLVEILLKYRANPNSMVWSYWGSTLLQVARTRLECPSANLELPPESSTIVSLLLKAGAEDICCFTPEQLLRRRLWHLSEAILKRDIDMVRQIGRFEHIDLKSVLVETRNLHWLQSRNIHAKSKEQLMETTLLHLCLTTFRLQCQENTDRSILLFKFPINHVGDVNVYDKSVVPLLYIVISLRHPELVRIILEKQADVNFQFIVYDIPVCGRQRCISTALALAVHECDEYGRGPPIPVVA